MSAEHTPGPWFIHRPHGTIYIEARLRDGMLQEVAACGPTEECGQQEANAALIASAPDLLAERDRLKAANAELAKALQDVIGWVPGRAAWHTNEPIKAAERARAALTKHQGATA